MFGTSIKTHSGSSSGRPTLKRKLFIILAVVLLLIVLAYVHLALWPKLILRMDNSLREGLTWSNIRLCLTIQNNFESIWEPHAQALMEVDERLYDKPFDLAELKYLMTLPGVQDAFYINFKDEQGESFHEIISTDTLRNKLDRRGQSRTGGASRMMRRLVGGLTRFKGIKVDDKKYPVMVRYVNTYYPARANEVIGLILNTDWVVSQVPAKLDSLANEDGNLLFMAPALPDTNFNRPKPEDPYASPGGNWKQTLGVMHAQDTLWWLGDPNVDILSKKVRKYVRDTYWIGLDEFDILIGAKTEFPDWQADLISDYRKFIIYISILEFSGILLVIVLLVSIRLTSKQASRNRIALAHLAHAIKTPVARIRLDTDSLLEEMVASPDEEREIITAIGRECGRMEVAVQSAALSLEEGKRTLNLESGDLYNIVTNTAQAWQSQFDQVGIKLKIDLIDEALSGRYDAEMIAIMIDNLLDNALRHTMLNLENTGQNAVVTVALNKSGGKAQITIDDMGAGIPANERKHIFKRFQRVKGDAASGVSGLGLGLALVKEIAEAHGGNVSVTDNDARGARFVVKLPL